jgi:hypothetical protein
MRTLQQTEINSVSGAGLLTTAVTTAVRAGAAVGNGLVQAGTIVFTPVVTTAVKLIKFLI